MNDKNKKSDPLSDLINAMADFLMKLTEIAAVEGVALFNLFLERFVLKGFKRKNPVQKIEQKFLEKEKTTLKEESLGYCINRKQDFPLKEINRRRHSLVCGASGFGKSVLLDTLMYDDMKNGKPVIFIDPKGDRDSLEQFIGFCRLTKNPFKVFSEYYAGSGSTSLNPLKDGSAAQIADRLHYAFEWSEEHYENLCYDALLEACKNLKRQNKTPSMDAILNYLEETPPSKRKDIQGIVTRLKNIVNSEFGDSLEEDGESFKDLWESGTCVYIGLPVLGHPRTARILGKILLGDISGAVYGRYKESVRFSTRINPIGLYIDELSSVITDEFIELLNKCRGAVIELTTAFQTPSDINKVSPHLCRQILENTANWFILKQRDESGANMFAESIGTVVGKKETRRVRDGIQENLGSQREVHELIVHHNIIKSLNCGQCLLLQHSPTQVDLLNIKYIDPYIVQSNIKYREERGIIEKLSGDGKKEDKKDNDNEEKNFV